jgi:hypothetical protein
MRKEKFLAHKRNNIFNIQLLDSGMGDWDGLSHLDIRSVCADG